MEALTMEGQTDSWNDERLDELSGRVDDGFTKVDRRFERLEGELKGGFAKAATKDELGEVKEAFKELATKEELRGVKGEVGGLKGEMGEVKGELRRLNEKFDRLLFALMVVGVSFGITMLATLGGWIVTQA